MIATLTTVTSNRKRSRPQVSPTFKSLSFLALALLLVVSQASAFSDSSTSLPDAEYQSLKFQRYGAAEIDDDEGWIIEEADEDEEEEEGWEYYYEEYDEDDEDYWTPEQIEEMDALYERYLQKVAAQFGTDWQEKYELNVNKEDVYLNYLEFEEEKKIKEERRLLIEASHRALCEHKALRVEEEYHTQRDNNSLNRTQDQNAHLVVLGNNAKQNNGQNSQAKTTIVAITHGGNTHTVIGSI
jgi:hypothetical protein